MGLKDKLKIFAQDKLSHYQWSTWIVTLSATLTIAFMARIVETPVHITAAVSACVSIFVAAVLGFAGEAADAVANKKAAALGLPAPHTVSEGDVIAATLGCLPTAVPLGLIAFLTWM